MSHSIVSAETGATSRACFVFASTLAAQCALVTGKFEEGTIDGTGAAHLLCVAEGVVHICNHVMLKSFSLK